MDSFRGYKKVDGYQLLNKSLSGCVEQARESYFCAQLLTAIVMSLSLSADGINGCMVYLCHHEIFIASLWVIEDSIHSSHTAQSQHYLHKYHHKWVCKQSRSTIAIFGSTILINLY